MKWSLVWAFYKSRNACMYVKGLLAILKWLSSSGRADPHLAFLPGRRLNAFRPCGV